MMEDQLSYSYPDAENRLILLHGWGADADDLIAFGQEISTDIGFKKTELIALRAPQVVPQGIGRQWYGLFPPQWSEVPSAVNQLRERLENISRSKIPLNKTVLLGFSQGGAMALASGCELPLAGLIGCSAYPHPDWVAPIKRPPVLLSHGSKDEVVPYEASEKLFTLLNQSAQELNFVRFEGGHAIPRELIPRFRSALISWLQ